MKHWLITGMFLFALMLPVAAAPLRTINDYLTGQPVQAAVADGTVYEFRATVPKVNFWKTPAPLDGLWIESPDKKTLIWMSSTSGIAATDTVPCPPATGTAGTGGGIGTPCASGPPPPPTPTPFPCSDCSTCGACSTAEECKNCCTDNCTSPGGMIVCNQRCKFF